MEPIQNKFLGPLAGKVRFLFHKKWLSQAEMGHSHFKMVHRPEIFAEFYQFESRLCVGRCFSVSLPYAHFSISEKNGCAQQLLNSFIKL